jgi:hypothetical protein
MLDPEFLRGGTMFIDALITLRCMMTATPNVDGEPEVP